VRLTPALHLRGREKDPTTQIYERLFAGRRAGIILIFMPPLRRPLRTACALLVLLGLGTSLLEGVRCNEAPNGVALQVAGVAANAFSTPNPSEAPAPSATDCCPCIHGYPNAFRVALVPVLPLVGYTTDFGLVYQAPPDRHPQPLVPPPIA